MSHQVLFESPAFVLKAGLFLAFTLNLGAEQSQKNHPATEITQVEERLLTMAPFFSAWTEELSADLTNAAAKRIYPSAPLVEPLALGPPSSSSVLENWNTTLLSWSGIDSATRPYKPGMNRPFSWLREHIPDTGKVRIKTYDGELVPYQKTFLFRTHHKFLISSKPGAPLSHATAEVKLDWGSDGSQLLIIRWQLLSVKILHTPNTTPILATDQLEASIPDAQTYADLRECRHETYMRAAFQKPNTLHETGLPGFDLHGYKHITYESAEQHPGVSVADVNADGHDDIYLSRRWGPNRLLTSNGDGTFTENAATHGLDIQAPATCALFLDLDNDGDQDAFIGRTLRRSLLLENREGRFHDISAHLSDAGLPYLVSSATAADYDGDGLLDLYIGTYASQREGWKYDYLDLKDIDEYNRRVADSNPYYDFAAAPNLLIKNTGNLQFIVAPENDQVRLWRATLQPTFADWDQDGDPDLLVTNDFGPDVMLRNDPGIEGQRTFTDVTAEIAPGVATNYFGMGGSWGDYNNDGHLDLYLSAMFSKAGTRITDRLRDFDVRARQSTQGNLLFAGGPAGLLTQTSGNGPSQHHVHQVGWAWGGQFFDPDNDGHLDLYAPTGYFTPPPDLALQGDF